MNKITAPMPGTVVAIIAKPGDSVIEGQDILVIEAMKMEMPIPASASGIVQEIACNIGDAVATGAILAVIG